MSKPNIVPVIDGVYAYNGVKTRPQMIWETIAAPAKLNDEQLAALLQWCLVETHICKDADQILELMLLEDIPGVPRWSSWMSSRVMLTISAEDRYLLYTWWRSQHIGIGK